MKSEGWRLYSNVISVFIKRCIASNQVSENEIKQSHL